MTNALKAPIAGTDPLASDVAQLANVFSANSDVGALTLSAPQLTQPAPTVAASGSAGNLNGAYLYTVVLVTGWKQGDGSYYVSGFAPSLESTSVTIANGQGSLSSIPTGTQVVIARAIYRTKAGGASGTEQFAGILWDNATTTWTDNVADSSLGTGMPSSSSNPVVYGTPIPAAVPNKNTTGTYITTSSTPSNMNNQVNQVVAYELDSDTRTVTLNYNGAGQLTSVVETDPTNGNATVATTTLNYSSSGQLSSVAETAGGHTVTTTLNYTNGQLSSVTKAVQ